MIGPAFAAWVLAAAPASFITRGDLQPQGDVLRDAAASWQRISALYAGAGGVQVREPGEIRLVRGTELKSRRSGESQPGLTRVRQNVDWSWGAPERTALAHELAHQFLWSACPASASDELFHEAFALATSGELAAWSEGPYLSLSRAAEALRRLPLDSSAGRSALARVLAETQRASALPLGLSRRIRGCASGNQWARMTLAELLDDARLEGESFVVLNRHSGEVLVAEGAARTAMPFGSTLKPFVVAGTASAPRLSPRRGDPEWECGKGLPPEVDVATALLRSCNGYFLDWAAKDGAAARLGAWGPVLAALGLGRAPEEMSEAIGLRTTLALSPLAMAEAYRALALARPDVLEILQANAERGTLSELPASPRLFGVALKTGTVRDAEVRPRLGWIVAVDGDRVLVMTRPGQMPRGFAGEFADRLIRARSLPAQAEQTAQVFALLPPEQVEARCSGAGMSVRDGAPRLLPRDFVALRGATSGAAAICLGGPWRVRFPGLPDGRPYAGSFTSSPPPLALASNDPRVPARAQKARRGSELIFHTSLSLYAAGVLAAEDAQIRGPAREALLRVVAHNARNAQERHGGRPVCDTTHCQAFQGTVAPRPEDLVALGRAELRWPGWLPFSQGGDEPWSERKSLTEVEGLLGATPLRLRFEPGAAYYTATEQEGDALYESETRVGCERLRGPLRLPSCPKRAQIEGGWVLFEGHGRGHGVGLDVEAAKKSALPADQLLEGAYPEP